MFNKDVILQISIAAAFCVFIIPPGNHSLAQKRTEGGSDTCYNNTNATYDSYENYLPEKKRELLKTSEVKKKQIANKKQMVFIRYKVRKGDTLTSIAKKNHVSISSLKSLNKLSNRNIITKGMILKIPSKKAYSALSHDKKKEAGHKSTAVLKNRPHFQWPIKNVKNYHNDGLNGVKSIGIIITGKPGSTVLSSASGTVRKIGRMRGFGKYIVITHSSRYSTVYSNLDIIMVSPGDSVSTGNVIGKMSSTEQKIHFQIDREGKPEDPLLYLPKKS